MNVGDMQSDQGRPLGFVEGSMMGQPMANHMTGGMMSPTNHQSMKGGYMPQQMSGQFHHPRTSLVCYGKMSDMPGNVAMPGMRCADASPQSRNYFYGGAVGPYGNSNQMNNMRYNSGNYYQPNVFFPQPSPQQQQIYYKHQQMSPMLPQNHSLYHDMPQQNVGYVHRNMPERQMSSPGWNGAYNRPPPQMMDGAGFVNCSPPNAMMKHGHVERFHSPGRYPNQTGGSHGVMADFKKERYMTHAQGSMTTGFDMKPYNGYAFDGNAERLKMNNPPGPKFMEEGHYGQLNPGAGHNPQLGGYIPGKRLEHFTQMNHHMPSGNYNASGFHVDCKVPVMDLEKSKYHTQSSLSYGNTVESNYYKANPLEMSGGFRTLQQSFSSSSASVHPANELMKKPSELDAEVYHSSSTETCSGSSSPFNFEVDSKYSLPNPGSLAYSSQASTLEKASRTDDVTVKTEPLSSINFLATQHPVASKQPSTCSTFSLEKVTTASIFTDSIRTSSSCLSTNPSAAAAASTNLGLLSQSMKSISSTVKVTMTPSKINSILDSMSVKKEPGIPSKPAEEAGTAKAVAAPRRVKKKKSEMGLEKIGNVKSISSRHVTVPFKWRRIIESKSVYYISPSRVRLESLKEICQYLLTDGTCKCGLLCPLYVDQVFVFDWTVESRYMSAEEAYNSSINLASLCYHKRKFKQSASLAATAAATGAAFNSSSSCRNYRYGAPPSLGSETFERGKKISDIFFKLSEPSKPKGDLSSSSSLTNVTLTSSQKTGESDIGRTPVRKRAYTKLREKRKSKLETSLCDSLKNINNPQRSASVVTQPNPIASTTNRFGFFSSRQSEDFRQKVIGQMEHGDLRRQSCPSPYDSDATKSASDVYCSTSGSSDEDEDVMTFASSKSQSFTLKSNFPRTSADRISTCVQMFGGKTDKQGVTFVSLSSFKMEGTSRSMLGTGAIVSGSIMHSSVGGNFSDGREKLQLGNLSRNSLAMSESKSNIDGVDPSPIKLVENMVFDLLATKNSLAEVTTLMMSKAETERRRKFLLEGGGKFGHGGGKMSSFSDESPAVFGTKVDASVATNKIEESIQQNLSGHVSKQFSLSQPEPPRMLVASSSSLGIPSSSYQSITSKPTDISGLPSLTLPQMICDSLLNRPLLSSLPTASLVSANSSSLINAPGFFHKPSLDASDALTGKLATSEGVSGLQQTASSRVFATGSTTMTANPAVLGQVDTGTEEMFSEDEEDNSSCAVIENWLEKEKDKGSISANNDDSPVDGGNKSTVANGSGSAIAALVAGDEEDLMKTTGTQTSTPASNASNSTLELVDHDADSRETICCANIEQNSNLLEDVPVVSSSSLLSVITAASALADANATMSSAAITTSCSSTVAISSCCSASIPAPSQQQVAQAQVVMVPTQQPFLIPHHQTCGFDAQLYQTSPAGYLQSLGFGFAQGQVGLLHFGQVVNPSSSSSSQGLGLALGLGVNLSGGVFNASNNNTSTSSTSSSSSNSRDQIFNQAQVMLSSSSDAVTSSASSDVSSQNVTTESSAVQTTAEQVAPPVSSINQELQAASTSVSANQLFQLVVSQGVQPAHHFLVPNYSSFAPFAGAALVPVPMVQQNSMAFCNLVTASGAPTLFTVGQSPFGFVAPAAVQMLTGVGVGEKRLDSFSSAASSHDAPDSTVDSEEVTAVSNAGSAASCTGAPAVSSANSEVCSASIISSNGDNSSCSKYTSPVVFTAGKSAESDKCDKVAMDSSSLSDTDNEIGAEINQDDLQAYDGATPTCRKNGNCTDRWRADKRSDTGSLLRGQHLLGVSKLLQRKRSKRLKGYALLVKSRMAGKSTGLSAAEAGPTKILPSCSPAFTGGSSENTSEANMGEVIVEKSTGCSSSGDCMVTTTDTTATEDSQGKPMTNMKGILRKNFKARKLRERAKMVARKPKPDSPVSSDDTIDDADSTTTTTATNAISLQNLRSFNIGDLVWGPARGFPSWPGKLVSENEVRGNPKPESGKIWVKWFGDNTYAQADLDQLKTLSEGLETHHNARKSHRKGRKMNAGLEAAIQEAMVELDKQMTDHREKSSGNHGNGSSNERSAKKSRRC